MKVAVISDIHDRVSNLEKMLGRLEQSRPDVLLCCGDVTRPETLLRMAGFPAPVHFCLGNCDGPELLSSSRGTGNLIPARTPVGRLKVGPGSIAFTHFPDLARREASSGKRMAVFYGHTHRLKSERIYSEDQKAGCLVANPGDIQGRFGNRPSALIWDSETDELRWEEI
jgi:putative phosphoesterase